jgi:DNA-directed RNA polymerase specialized sigma24 family protein
VKPPTLDSPLYDDLVARAAGGDAPARHQLLESLWSTWGEMVRANRSMGSFAKSDDHVDNVVGTLVEKFGRPDGRALRQYLAWRAEHDQQTFGDWLRIVTKNVIRDYLRAQLGSEKPTATGDLSVKRVLNEFAMSPAIEELGVRPPVTAAQTARELLEFAAERLPAQQLRSLRHWLDGASFDEIGDACGTSRVDAQRSVRASIAVLRRHFIDVEANPGLDHGE